MLALLVVIMLITMLWMQCRRKLGGGGLTLEALAGMFSIFLSIFSSIIFFALSSYIFLTGSVHWAGPSFEIKLNGVKEIRQRTINATNYIVSLLTGLEYSPAKPVQPADVQQNK